MFSEIIMVKTETWLNGSTVERARGNVLALYTARMSLGFGTCPLILAWTGSNENLVTLLAAVDITLIVIFGMSRVETDDEVSESLSGSLKHASLPIMAMVLKAAVEMIGVNFLSLYATKQGWNESASALLISVLMFGAIVLQLPVGWLADMVNRHRLDVFPSFYLQSGPQHSECIDCLV